MSQDILCQDRFIKEHLKYMEKGLGAALGYAAGAAWMKTTKPNKLGKRLIFIGEQERDGLIKEAQDDFNRIVKYIKETQHETRIRNGK